MDRMISSVVAAAGLPPAGYSCTPLGAAIVNATYLLQFDSGDRYVAWIYRWPFDVPDDLDRVNKEIWISDLKRVHGIPAARTVAKVETDVGAAVLRVSSWGATRGSTGHPNPGMARGGREPGLNPRHQGRRRSSWCHRRPPRAAVR